MIEHGVQSDYFTGEGWEDSYVGENRKDAQKRLNEYREFQPQADHRIVSRKGRKKAS